MTVTFVRIVALVCAIFATAPLLPVRSGAAAEPDTIKVGILHSLYGPVSIVATSLKDEMLMLIEEQNAKGGLLGRKLEPVVMDMESNPQLAARLARDLTADWRPPIHCGRYNTVTKVCESAPAGAAASQ
jgi:urea transport system substrate-binding protein